MSRRQVLSTVGRRLSLVDRTQRPRDGRDTARSHVNCQRYIVTS